MDALWRIAYSPNGEPSKIELIKGEVVVSSGHIRDILTTRELDIAKVAIKGYSQRDIANAFDVSPETVKLHLKRIFQKLRVSNKTELAGTYKDAIEIATQSGRPYQFYALENRIDIELLTSDGSKATYTKHVVLQALSDGASEYVDGVYADGQAADFWVQPGAVVETKHEKGMALSKTTFGRTLRDGEILERDFGCTLLGTFSAKTEYWVQEQVYPSLEFELRIVFPKIRPPAAYRGLVKTGNYESACDVAPKHTEVQGQTMILWKITNPLLKDFYKLEWDW